MRYGNMRLIKIFVTRNARDVIKPLDVDVRPGLIARPLATAAVMAVALAGDAG
jgi:hypothetical protein